MKESYRFIFFLGLVLASNILWGQKNQADLTLVAVGEAEVEAQRIIFPPPYLTQDFSIKEVRRINSFLEVMANDFSFYRKFFSVDRYFKRVKSGKLKDSFGRPNSAYWKNLKADFLVQVRVRHGATRAELAADIYLTHILKNKVILKEKIIFKQSNLREVAHRVADSLYKTITGREKSIFNSKIVFVSDKVSVGPKIVKELYIMDFDGRNMKRLTRHNRVVVSPAISHDGTKIVYSLIAETKGIRNVDLYIMDLKSRKVRLLSRKKGINSGAIFMPGDKSIALTLTYTGNAEIFEMNLQTLKTRKITNLYSNDVDPSVASDGTLMAFLSDRPKKAMIYTLDPRGTEKNIKRVSFVGQFNATPRFSPDGQEIAFASWLDNRFDIFRINRDGTGLHRLTRNFGSNEDPTYSNDGEFIAFSSQRVLSRKKAIQNIYIMDKDGEILGAVTKKMGNCISPRWSK